jgi:alkanesulfonate monooxygenase SsuD/methylene tetrahydromethanopterin reductase-like flavin-dependent oxidoreductase (luciferase family)
MTYSDSTLNLTGQQWATLHPQERAAIDDFLAAAVIGGPDTVRAGLTALLETTAANELMLVCDIFDPALRLRSLDLVAAALTR